ncbi:hypothetical protein R3P38DRAFT_3567021 [Favolaschia claudopus]|uniref:Cyclin N-terminal domain-containing protein n=1 Tax=Favolaschia claudopus TaxID=2862362 RepID=A0AAW0AV68_9AGAR
MAASQNLQVVNRANVSDISSNSANDGHHYIAELSARFICHLFCCVAARTKTDMPLPSFISAVLQRIRVHSNVPYVALVLLQRLKARFPQARGSSGHRLFLSTLMIASKMVCDATFSNLSWSIAAQNIFPLREINAMERHMCNLLDWELHVDSRILRNFQAMVRQDFSSWSKRPYPTYSKIFTLGVTLDSGAEMPGCDVIAIVIVPDRVIGSRTGRWPPANVTCTTCPTLSTRSTR